MERTEPKQKERILVYVHGPSGSGKGTLLSPLSGYFKADRTVLGWKKHGSALDYFNHLMQIGYVEKGEKLPDIFTKVPETPEEHEAYKNAFITPQNMKLMIEGYNKVELQGNLPKIRELLEKYDTIILEPIRHKGQLDLIRRELEKRGMVKVLSLKISATNTKDRVENRKKNEAEAKGSALEIRNKKDEVLFATLRGVPWDIIVENNETVSEEEIPKMQEAFKRILEHAIDAYRREGKVGSTYKLTREGPKRVKEKGGSEPI
ncbi:hypothetical protein COX85_00630 [Candidatus Micrarchaeota archaeon CG_4_10_14_0_2_um_filter_55_9]|nr:MAG: hypothetical protein AUJ15_01105 [Candidatus Micrarchaeota archaeon CG1_02_55_41]PIZ92032.1 MAG: hypothetical protein COX85_00630 [Candidatus Micrarchaeota archaeon CG_4_10_14_0_2_um_filter_55_9]